jgi:outer membrane lipoprotein-sorting protein
MRKFAVLAVLVALVAGACGGSGSSKSDSASEKKGSSSQDDSGDGSSGDSSSDNAEDAAFKKLLDEASKERIKVTYESDGDNAFTISQDGEGKQAFFSDNSVYISDGDTVTTCDNLDREPSCQQLSGTLAKSALLPFTTILALAKTTIEGADRASGLGKSTSEDIAGRSADCVTISFGGSFTACADKETGILLKWEVKGGGEKSSLLATKVEEPSDSDFEPPAGATVETMPDISIPETPTT